MSTHAFASIAAALLLAISVAATADPMWGEPAPLHRFTAFIREYVQLHRQIERQLPPLHVRSDVQDIVESSNAMASALRTARATAREGDVFTPALATLLRARISGALAARGFLPEELVAATLEEADENAPLPVVNGRFPWARGSPTWPCVIDALPDLPDELQYRMVGNDLVLVDTHAGLVVDILRNAIWQ